MVKKARMTTVTILALLTDRICYALNNGAGGPLLTLLPLAHIASGGTTAALAAAEPYCSDR